MKELVWFSLLALLHITVLVFFIKRYKIDKSYKMGSYIQAAITGLALSRLVKEAIIYFGFFCMLISFTTAQPVANFYSGHRPSNEFLAKCKLLPNGKYEIIHKIGFPYREYRVQFKVHDCGGIHEFTTTMIRINDNVIDFPITNHYKYQFSCNHIYCNYPYEYYSDLITETTRELYKKLTPW